MVDVDDLRFASLSTAQGLSQTRVQQIVQDDQGFLWFGTQNGLNRYDGYGFTVFTHDAARSNSLGGVYIYSLFKDRAGYLWIGSDETLDRFDPKTESFTHYRLHRPGSDEDATVFHINQDHEGEIWLATAGAGLFRLDPGTGKTTLFQHDPTDPRSLASNNIKSTLEDSHGRFWVATRSGLDEFDRRTGKVGLHVPISGPVREFLAYEDGEGLLWLVYGSGGGAGLSSYDPQSNVRSDYALATRGDSGAAFTGVYAITQDHEGALWIGTGGLGLLKLDRIGRRFLRYRHVVGDPESIAEDHITALLEDRQGNMWVGLHATPPNFFAPRPGPFRRVLRTLGPQGAGERLVSSVFKDREGTLWVGAAGGLYRIDPRSAASTFYTTGQSTVSAGVVAIAQDTRGDLWLGTVGQGLKRFDPHTGRLKTYTHDPANPNSLSDDVVSDLRFDGPENLWISTWDGLDRLDIANETFTVYKPDLPYGTQRYGRISQDRQGIVWIAGDPGLTQFNPRNSQFAVARHADGMPTISSDAVNFVFIDSDARLWVGTRNGLDKLNADGTYTAYQKRTGRDANSVSCILEDNVGRLWLSTNKGLSSFDRRSLSFTDYSAADGLDDLTGWSSCLKASSGELFFGGFSGLVAFYPDKIVESFSHAPIRLTELRIGGRSVPIGIDSVLTKAIGYTDAITLPADQRNFSLEFASLSFRNPSGIRYRYKMEGLDSQWTEGGSDRRGVSFSGLPPGSYIFRAQAAVGREPWTEPGAVLRIRILPPWWSTWWFRLACVIAAIALASWLFRLKLRQNSERVTLRMEERLAERTRIAQDLHDTVLQGLLSVSMQMAVANTKLADADPVKRDFASLLASLRQVAEESRNAVRGLRRLTARAETLADALSHISQDLATDSRTDLTVRVEGEPHSLKPYVQEELYLIAREAIANAFRHAEATEIDATVRYSLDWLVVSIRDNGVGIGSEAAEDGRLGHFGLRGMRERATRIGAKLRMTSAPGAGTEVQVFVPAPLAFESAAQSRIEAWLGRRRVAQSIGE